MATDWIQDQGKWYYMKSNGAMAVNEWIGNYYVGSDGVMMTNAWVGQYYVGADGAWIPNYDTDDTNSISSNNPSKVEAVKKKSVKLVDLEPADAMYVHVNENSAWKDPLGNKYGIGTTLHLAGGDCYATYYTNGEYNVFSGIIAPNEKFGSSSELKFTVYADDEEIYSIEEIKRLSEPEEFEVDISGAKFVKFEVTGGSWLGNSGLYLTKAGFKEYTE